MFFDTDQAAFWLSYKIPTGVQNIARKGLMRQKRKSLRLNLLIRVYIRAYFTLDNLKTPIVYKRQMNLIHFLKDKS